VKSAERLASLFLKVNRDRKLLNAFEKYIGALDAKDKGTLDIHRILSEFNLEVAKSATTAGKVPAGAVARIHANGGSELVQRVFSVREMAWGNSPSREANEGKTLQGIASFLKRYWDKIEDDRLIAILQKQHPGYILKAVDKSVQIKSYSDYLRDQYNKGLRGQKKL
jgi:hypothetical protein